MAGPTPVHTSTDPKANGEPKIYTPISGSPAMGSPYGPRDGRMHNGVDIPCSPGTPCIAPVDGKITHTSTSGFGLSGGMVHFEFQEDLGGIKAGDKIGWGHPTKLDVSVGDTVRAGSRVCVSGYPAAPHVHFVYLPGGGGGSIDGTADPGPIYSRLSQGSAPTGEAGGGAGGTDPGGSTATSGVEAEDIFAAGRAAAYSTQLQLPGVLNKFESMQMHGSKSVYNDEPIMDFVQQVCKASMRQFQSLPNGAFFAFYPDQFGLYGHRKAYWKIKNIEITDGAVDLNDDNLATHVFVTGDTVAQDGVIDLADLTASHGVITIYDAFASNFNFKKIATEKKKDKREKEGKGDDNSEAIQTELARTAQAQEFLKRYGIRPYVEEALTIWNPYFEIFYAFTQFQTLWANQFRTQFSFTFMPELYPGGIVEFEDHNLQCYIDSVTHTFDYESGFTTMAMLSAPNGTHGADNGLWAGLAGPFLGEKGKPFKVDFSGAE